MKMRFVSWVVFLLLTIPAVAGACPVCFGDPESAEVEGVKWAIMFLVLLTAFVLSSIIAFAVHFRRRSRLLAADDLQVPSSY